jgi:uncharacterized protein YcbX
MPDGRMHITHLYRYPVKGLAAEPLASAMLEPGQAIAWDRAFALALGDTAFDPGKPAWLPKNRFMCLLKHASIASLTCRFNPETGEMAIASAGDEVRADALTEEGRAVIGAWLTGFLGEAARGEARFLHVPGHVFADQPRPVVTLINLASLAALEAAAGAARDRMRFRANVYLEGAPAWSEFGWVGREIAVGAARLRVVDRTERCAATAVNPATAQRDANPVKELLAAFGHPDLGVHAEVIEGGAIGPGDMIRLS